VTDGDRACDLPPRTDALIRLIPSGRLGNQLFQYVAVRAQAKRVGADLEIDPQFYAGGSASSSFGFWLDTLPIKARTIRYPASGPLSAHGIVKRGFRQIVQPLLWKKYVQAPWTFDSGFFAIGPRTIVSGFFQSLFYLLPRDDEILAEVDFAHAAPAQAIARARSIASDGFVSVHVRRGDAVWRRGESDTLPVWQDDYLSYVEAAMDLIRGKSARPTFLIFSDDIEWCKRTAAFGRDCEFLETNQFGDNPAIDLLLMSACRHHVLANSSYSWWAAWAAPADDGMCVVPRKWTQRDTTEALRLVSPGWIVL
jgi:hypothetical protein